MPDVRIGVVGATGAVGTVTLELLAERGSRRCARSRRPARPCGPFPTEGVSCSSRRRRRRLSPRATSTSPSSPSGRTPAASLSRMLFAAERWIDKSGHLPPARWDSAVVAGVNDHALDGSEIVANPNCSAMQLACVLGPLREAAGLARVRLATYQSASEQATPASSGCAASPRQRAIWAWIGNWRATSSPRSGSSVPKRGRSSSSPSSRCTRPASACPCWSVTPRRSGSRRSRRSRRRRPARRSPRRSSLELRRPPDAGRRSRPRQGARRAHPRRHGRRGPGLLGRQRQPAQRRAERRSDRRAAAGAPAATGVANQAE